MAYRAPGLDLTKVINSVYVWRWGPPPIFPTNSYRLSRRCRPWSPEPAAAASRAPPGCGSRLGTPYRPCGSEPGAPV